MVIIERKTLPNSINDVQRQQRSSADKGEPATASCHQHGVKANSENQKDGRALDTDRNQERYDHDQPKVSVQADRRQTSYYKNVGIADRVQQAGPKPE